MVWPSGRPESSYLTCFYRAAGAISLPRRSFPNIRAFKRLIFSTRYRLSQPKHTALEHLIQRPQLQVIADPSKTSHIAKRKAHEPATNEAERSDARKL
eukprot:358661-Chlamydomonas_euryale.AAC.2